MAVRMADLVPFCSQNSTPVAQGMLPCRYVMGYVSTVFFLVFTVMMMLLGEEQAKGAHERLTHHEDA